MKLHIVTVGEPKLSYARMGWQEYLARLGHYHQVRVTHIANKRAYDPAAFEQAAGQAYKVGLVIDGRQFNSPELADFLSNRSIDSKEACFMIGGPEGLPDSTIKQLDFSWSLSRLTFPHDLAMVVTLEALYRASSIQVGHPYHKF